MAGYDRKPRYCMVIVERYAYKHNFGRGFLDSYSPLEKDDPNRPLKYSKDNDWNTVLFVTIVK
ncbi:MAG: hypothetical protein H0U27_01800 [Nitrosopumilus sp.]|nr:hypothetical protein [Nitrosopumilus sp.]